MAAPSFTDTAGPSHSLAQAIMSAALRGGSFSGDRAAAERFVNGTPAPATVDPDIAAQRRLGTASTGGSSLIYGSTIDLGRRGGATLLGASGNLGG